MSRWAGQTSVSRKTIRAGEHTSTSAKICPAGVYTRQHSSAHVSLSCGENEYPDRCGTLRAHVTQVRGGRSRIL
eukprot:6099650-Prymnesium_polylepis.2